MQLSVKLQHNLRTIFLRHELKMLYRPKIIQQNIKTTQQHSCTLTT